REILNVATDPHPDVDVRGILVTVFCLMIAPVMSSGIALAFATSPYALIPNWRLSPLAAAALLFIATLLLPTYFFGFHMKGVARDDTAAIVGIGLLIFFLFVGGVLFLMSWDQRRTPLRIFALGIMPLVLNMLAWTALLGLFVIRPPRELTSC